MRFKQAEKMEIIRIVEQSELGVKRTLESLGVSRSTFYSWYNRYLEEGYDGLAARKPKRRSHWNRIPDKQRTEVINLALEMTEYSSRELAWFITDTLGWYISESSVYRILKQAGLISPPTHELIKAADEFTDKTTRVNEMWQTDFTYFKVFTWGWYYLSTILDDYSRYIIHWELCKNMKRADVERNVNRALEKTGIPLNQRPKLLSDNGSCYIAKELGEFMTDHGIKHIRGRAHHPQTQGKIERYHRSLKNVIKLDTYYFPEQLKEQIGAFIEHYNNHRYHESLDNMTPADVYFGRSEEIMNKRKQTKIKTLKKRRLDYLDLKLQKMVS
jgi:transposase InsO family protein